LLEWGCSVHGEKGTSKKGEAATGQYTGKKQASVGHPQIGHALGVWHQGSFVWVMAVNREKILLLTEYGGGRGTGWPWKKSNPKKSE